ncbi:MAG: diaminopimelate epimerase [Desulfobulbaceae bacterium]|nr:diaminopimelate epimerase [Desulfobulbaceae bacterium]
MMPSQALPSAHQFPIPFTKMSGTGNDFIIIDHRQRFLASVDLSQFARLVCRHKFSAGADGLILIEEDAREDFRWQFFNADGSRAEMCGNGARCAARFAYRLGIAQETMRFQTEAGVITAQIVEQGVKIKLTAPVNLQMGRSIDLGDSTKMLHSVNTGVPHVVCFVDDLAAVPVSEWGRTIRYHEIYQPAGTNVNFVQATNDGLAVRTYERGVEGETMACGTGAVASALIAAKLGLVKSPVQVTTSGGEKLVIHLESQGSGVISDVYLEGPAKIIYDGQLQAEALT